MRVSGTMAVIQIDCPALKRARYSISRRVNEDTLRRTGLISPLRFRRRYLRIDGSASDSQAYRIIYAGEIGEPSRVFYTPVTQCSYFASIYPNFRSVSRDRVFFFFPTKRVARQSKTSPSWDGKSRTKFHLTRVYVVFVFRGVLNNIFRGLCNLHIQDIYVFVFIISCCS